MSECMSDAAQRLAGLAAGAAPRAGATRVLAIDGRSGSGKSTLAREVALATGAAAVAMEDLYGGWDGLREGIDRLVREILAPLSQGRDAHVPRYDWVEGRWLEPVTLRAPALLVVEGVGAGALAAAPHVSVLAWVELEHELRRERALARDADIYTAHWERWARQEQEYLRTDRTPERADVIIEGVGPS
jgi:para-aminobenzoate synthetase